MGLRLSPREPGRSKGQVAELRWRTADEWRRVGHQDTEDDPRRPVTTQESKRPLGSSAILECGAGVKNGTAPVLARDEESRPRETEP
ncbi:hypothetical protein NDU88_006583 [Pleurodeles waltl]|uniref:Uncharacterized protein n=1 Tax=Pleurodeles waltl TaxID=8319 RepID=A0AAV7VRD9_PLEWA|nr:hypothetical protein NDU88_006583 [Pleurodeles waltl]